MCSFEIDRAEEYLYSRKIHIDNDIQYPHEMEFFVLAELYLAKGDLGFASSLLERMSVWAETDSHPLWLIRILALQSLIHQARQDEKLSMQLLKRAIDLAEPDGCIQLFVDLGKPMIPLLEAMRELQPHSAFLDQLLRALSDMPDGSVSGQASPRQIQTKEFLKNGLIDPLSKREMEVIKLIAEGFSNKEIALKLHVSVRTVKYYTTGIYTKLNVSGRVHAVGKARELGLLE